MIFVTVGNATQSFLRLLKAVDDLAGQNAFHGEPVLMQTGHNSGFVPRYSQSEAFMTMDHFIDSMKQARLIICHGGCGTLIQAIALGKTPIAMPRRACYGEHVNDHQLQLIHALAEEGRIVPAYESDDLPIAIEAAGSFRPHIWPKGRMLDLVDKAVEDLLAQKIH